MAVSKKDNLAEYELDFLDMKLRELKDYIEANPLSSIADRMAYKETRTGGVIPICIANKEAQRKDLTQALKDYAEIVRTVKSLREIEEAKQKQVRGNQNLSPFENGDI